MPPKTARHQGSLSPWKLPVAVRGHAQEWGRQVVLGAHVLQLWDEDSVRGNPPGGQGLPQDGGLIQASGC